MSNSYADRRLSGRLRRESHIIDIMGDGDFAGATIVDEPHSSRIWLEALRAGTHQLEVEASCQTDPRVGDVVAVPYIHHLQTHARLGGSSIPISEIGFHRGTVESNLLSLF